MSKQGSKWISRNTRLAIYLRDGMACAYCGSTLEGGEQKYTKQTLILWNCSGCGATSSTVKTQ